MHPQKSYWCGTPDDAKYDLTQLPPPSSDSDDASEAWETEPEGIPGVQVQDLYKVFRSKTGSNVYAVNGIRFSAFSGQIMALLGHNGAGKTTTMSMLTGQGCCGSRPRKVGHVTQESVMAQEWVMIS